MTTGAASNKKAVGVGDLEMRGGLFLRQYNCTRERAVSPLPFYCSYLWNALYLADLLAHFFPLIPLLRPWTHVWHALDTGFLAYGSGAD